MSHIIYYSKVNKQLEFSWLSEVKVSSWAPTCVSHTDIFQCLINNPHWILAKFQPWNCNFWSRIV